MRQVYTPPRVPNRHAISWLGAAIITGAVFLVLPLTQMLSPSAEKELLLTRVDSAAPPPPPPPPLEQKPPPPPKERAEPKPELDEAPKPLSLADLDLDFDVGAGGALQAVFGSFQDAASAASELSVFDIADLDKPPERVVTVDPRVAGLPKVNGAVVVLFVVDEEGRVRDPRVESATHREFEQRVLEALKKWKFNPGSKDGAPVKTFVRQAFPFKLSS